jgi:hypothetical protein
VTKPLSTASFCSCKAVTRQDKTEKKKLQYIGVVKSNRKENEAYSAPFFKELALALARENEGLGFVLKLFS